MATDAAPAPPVDSEPVLESAGGRRFRIAEYAGFAPALILYGVFFAVPLGIIVAYSFWKVVDYNVVHQWTVDNYRYFFSVATYVRTLWATVWVSVLSTVLTIAVAFPFAYWLVRYVPRRMQRTLLVLVILPFWTSYLLRVYSWLNILGDQGAINRLLQWMHLTDHPVRRPRAKLAQAGKGVGNGLQERVAAIPSDRPGCRENGVKLCVG